MSDASAEAERLSLALRGRGHWVVDVPLGLLAGRVAVQRPAVVVCDADAPGTLETITRVHIAAGDRAIEVLLLGERTESPSDSRRELEKLAGGVFTRPVDAEALIDRVEQIVGPAGSRPSASGMPVPGGRSPVLVAATRRPYRYEGPRPGSRAPMMTSPPSGQASTPPSGPPGSPSQQPSAPASASSPSSAPSVAPSSTGRPSSSPPGAASRAPGSVVPQGIGAVPHAKLSPELELLLGRAEQRVRHSGASGPSIPAPAERLSPDAEVEAVLPADLLAALDEPLQDDDDDDGDDSAHGTAGGSETGSRGTRGTPEAGTATGGSRGASRTETTSTAPKPVPAPSKVETADEPLEDSSAFAQEAPTAPPRAPALPPPSLRSATSLDGPEPLVESRPTRPPPTSPEPGRESVPSVEAPSTRPPRSQKDERPVEQPSTPRAAHAARAEQPPPRPLEVPSEPPPGKSRLPDVPVVLSAGDGVRALARSIAARFTGAIAFEDDAGIRRVVFRDGDFVTAASSADGESLVGFLAQRGDLAAEVAQRVARRLPPFGRHAGAALVAQGHLRQDELWSVLRAHAEWLLGRVASIARGGASLEHEVPQRLQAEPGVFGGATGAEVLIETVRRVVPPAEAIVRLGGRTVRLGHGSARSLLGECALNDAQSALVGQADGLTLEELLARSGGDDFATVVWALVELGVLKAEASAVRARLEPAPKPAEWDPLDADAVRARVAARLSLVEEGDYFALLGVARDATSYDLRRAYTALRKAFDPGAVLTAATVDLKDDVDAILEVLEEAYDVLRDPVRRERYRRALEGAPRQ